MCYYICVLFQYMVLRPIIVVNVYMDRNITCIDIFVDCFRENQKI